MGHEELSERVFSDPGELKELIRLRSGSGAVPHSLKIITDTTDFLGVRRGDVVVIEGRPYLVRSNEREGRFGLDDEPKFWVKRATDLLSGATKILKLSFEESFRMRVGSMTFDFTRNPAKEARILNLVRGHPSFMQGHAAEDAAGNVVRIIDYISGGTLAEEILDLGRSHEEYFFSHFPGILRTFIGLTEAVAFLHARGEKHGDIRRDHIIRDSTDRTCRWIDFDYTFHNAANPYQYDLFGLGNILIYLAGKGDVTLHGLRRAEDSRLDILTEDDMNLVFGNRVANLRKIFPYIPRALNRTLLHFSAGARSYYVAVEELLEDLFDALPDAAGRSAASRVQEEKDEKIKS